MIIEINADKKQKENKNCMLKDILLSIKQNICYIDNRGD